jgi:hypothetical protein
LPVQEMPVPEAIRRIANSEDRKLDYFLANPPRKQLNKGGAIGWSDPQRHDGKEPLLVWRRALNQNSARKPPQAPASRPSTHSWPQRVPRDPPQPHLRPAFLQLDNPQSGITVTSSSYLSQFHAKDLR